MLGILSVASLAVSEKVIERLEFSTIGCIEAYCGIFAKMGLLDVYKVLVLDLIRMLENSLPTDLTDVLDCDQTKGNQGTWSRQTMINLLFYDERG